MHGEHQKQQNIHKAKLLIQRERALLRLNGEKLQIGDQRKKRYRCVNVSGQQKMIMISENCPSYHLHQLQDVSLHFLSPGLTWVEVDETW